MCALATICGQVQVQGSAQARFGDRLGCRGSGGGEKELDRAGSSVGTPKAVSSSRQFAHGGSMH